MKSWHPEMMVLESAPLLGVSSVHPKRNPVERSHREPLFCHDLAELSGLPGYPAFIDSDRDLHFFPSLISLVELVECPANCVPLKNVRNWHEMN